MDDFKRKIKGFRRGGRTCPCCREVPVVPSRRLARRRLRDDLRREVGALDDPRAAAAEVRLDDAPPPW